MAFRTSISVSGAFGALQTQAAATKQYLTAQRTAMQAATCDAAIPISVIQHLGSVDAQMAAWAATSGLAAYAQSQYNDPAYDVVSEYTTMHAAIVSAKNQLITMFPKDGSGFLLYQTLNANGTITNRTFTSAELAAAVTLINAVIAAIG